MPEAISFSFNLYIGRPPISEFFHCHGIICYYYAFNDEDLTILKTRVQKKPTYVLFNNLRIHNNALRFMERIGL